MRYSGPVQHVVLISLDTTRTDQLGCYGNDWVSTPRINELASESILFTNYVTVVPTTLASHTSLFTGQYPHSHGTPRNGFMVNKANLMLPEILKKAGFRTVGIPGSFALDSRFDFNQGFDYYNEDFDRFVGFQGFDQNQRLASAVTDSAIEYLEDKGIPSNLFLFVHYFDPHAPYRPPPPYDQMYREDAVFNEWIAQTQDPSKEDPAFRKRALQYAGEISYMDEHIGRLVDYLQTRHILDNAILIMTSDHGENFWDHPQFWDHGWSVYNTTMSALCLIRLPNGEKAGQRVEKLFSSIDVLPSLVRYLGLPISEIIDGESIDLEGDLSISPRTRFGQATKPWKAVEISPLWFNIHKSSCLFSGRMKFIQTPHLNTQELYDLAADPYEKNNLLTNPTPEIDDLRSKLCTKLQAWIESAHPLSSRFGPNQMEDTIRRLKALGYLE